MDISKPGGEIYQIPLEVNKKLCVFGGVLIWVSGPFKSVYLALLFAKLKALYIQCLTKTIRDVVIFRTV